MRILIQRVSHARVSVNGETIGEIDAGLLALVGIHHDDNAETAAWMAEKVANLRIFEDSEGKMNLSVRQVQGKVLAVSQFTLYGDTTKGMRPNFMAAAPPEIAETMYELFLQELAHRIGAENVVSGKFRTMMQVELTNDGPVTILLER